MPSKPKAPGVEAAALGLILPVPVLAAHLASTWVGPAHWLVSRWSTSPQTATVAFEKSKRKWAWWKGGRLRANPKVTE